MYTPVTNRWVISQTSIWLQMAWEASKAGDLASSYAVQKMIEAVGRCTDTRPALILQKSIRYANHQAF